MLSFIHFSYVNIIFQIAWLSAPIAVLNSANVLHSQQNLLVPFQEFTSPITGNIFPIYLQLIPNVRISL